MPRKNPSCTKDQNYPALLVCVIDPYLVAKIKQGSKRLNKNVKTSASGNPSGVHELKDGRIAEEFLEFGLPKLFIYNRDQWEQWREGCPQNIYWEF